MRKAQTDDSKEATLDLHFRSLMILLLGVYLLWINTNISPVDSCNMIRKKYIQESVIRGCKVSTTEDVIPKGNVRDKNCILYVSFSQDTWSTAQNYITINLLFLRNLQLDFKQKRASTVFRTGYQFKYLEFIRLIT